MDDEEYRLAFAAGWESALIEAERQCQRMWHPAGETVQATTNVELVMLRNAIKVKGKTS